MRILSRISTAGLVLAAATAMAVAADKSGFSFVDGDTARREVGALPEYDTNASMYIWADKYVYNPGEQLTLRGTIKPNNDLYPYTIVAYRINNQTGAKQYLPCGGADPCDIFGSSLTDGFRAVRIPALDKAVLVGAGGAVVNRTFEIPREFGMHTIVVQLRDFTGTRIVKSAYFKIGVVESTENVSGEITAATRWTNNRLYRLRGIVLVKNNAVLTIEPGTFIIGEPGSEPPSALVVTRNGRMVAEGTRSRPIIFTSSRPFGQRQRGDWGGVVLLGRAPSNWPQGTGTIEGLPPGDDSTYGGTDANWNCGSLKYVRVEYAGALVRPNDELNAVTWGGCGKATTTEFVQTTYGQDDAFEWFGGNNDARYIVGSYAKDDYLDWQIGWTGRVQHALVVVSDKVGSNRGIEADNNERDFDAQPLARPQLYNLTIWGSPNSPDDELNQIAGIWLRRGTGGDLRNVIVANYNQTGIEIRDAQTAARIEARTLTLDGLLLWNNGQNLSPAKPNTFEGQVNSSNTPAAVAAPFLEWVRNARGDSRNSIIADPMLRRPTDSSDPDFRPMAGSPVFRPVWVQPPDDGFFDQSAHYIGAFGNVLWTEEWTSFLQEEDIRP